MSLSNPADQITNILKEAHLSWLLPNLRQDFVVWNNLNDIHFMDKVIQRLANGIEVTASDFAPSKLALLALDQPLALSYIGNNILEAIDEGLAQSAIRNYNELKPGDVGSQNLYTAGMLAIALATDFQSTHTWVELLDAIQADPIEYWYTPIACLYGLVDDPTNLLNTLVRPGTSPKRLRLAVHTLLSNPFQPEELVEHSLNICEGSYQGALPARERLLLIRDLNEQRPQIAKLFCKKWFTLNPEDIKPINKVRKDSIEVLEQLEEDLFEIELNQIAGNPQNLDPLLTKAKLTTHTLHTGFKIQSLAQGATQGLDQKMIDQMDAINQEIINHKPSTISGRPNQHQAELALILVEHGFAKEASEIISLDSKYFPDDVDILYAMATVAEKIGNREYALKVADRLVSLLDQGSSGDLPPVWGNQLSLVNLGKLLLGLNKSGQAAHILEFACKTCPNNADLLLLLADSYKTSHKYHEAKDIQRTLVALFPETIDYHRAFAESLEMTGDWEAGLNERIQIICSQKEAGVLHPSEDLYSYARAALYADQPELTIRVCGEIFDYDPDDIMAMIYSGQAYLRSGDLENGLENLSKATQVAPFNQDTWLALAEAQHGRFPAETIIETLKSAAQAVPESARIHFKLGELYLQENTPTLALPELRFARELSPDDPHILYYFGKALFTLGHTEDSLNVFSKAYQVDPTITGLAELYSNILLEEKRFEEAIPVLEMLIEQKSSLDSKPYLDFARCILDLHKQGSTKYPPMKALIALNEVIQMDPDCAEARALIAETLVANGDKEIAFQAYREALDTSLIEDKVWRERLSFGFGTLAGSIGKYDIAIAALQEAAQANPGNPEIFKALSETYLAANLPEDSIRNARTVLVIEAENPDHLAWFANQISRLLQQEKADNANSSPVNAKALQSEALTALAKAIHLAPVRTDLLTQLAKFKASIGALNEARVIFASLASLDFAEIDDLKHASDYLSSIGDHEDAIACLENGISQDRLATGNHDVSLYEKLAKEHVKNNDQATAINVLDRALEILPGETSLVSLKIDILLGLGQSIDALNCIESTISTALSGTPQVNLLFLASKINRSIGDLSAAVRYARRGVDAFFELNGINEISALPLRYRSQVAEIYRALIQPDQAFNTIHTDAPLSASDFNCQEEYIDFICLHTELALELGGKIRQDIQEIQPDPSNTNFSRVTAITARLMNKAGNYKQAEQLFQIAENGFNHPQPDVEQPSWASPQLKYLTIFSIIEAALELHRWDQAMAYTQRLIETSALEPLSSITLAEMIILRAEFYNLCEIFDAGKHKPNINAISKEAQIQLSLNLDRAKTSLDQYKDSFLLAGHEIVDDVIYRWKARSEITFQSMDVDSNPIETLAASSFPSDAAATINCLHQIDLHAPVRESVTKIIKIARSYSRNPAVLLQVALAICDENPADAMKSLQAVLEQNPYSRNPTIAFCNALLAKIALQLDQQDIAQKAVENAIGIWQDEPEWHILAARIYHSASNFSGIIHHLSEATKLSPENINYQMDLGKAYLENSGNDVKMLKQANIAFSTAVELEPDNADALIFLAKTQSLLNDPDHAEQNVHRSLILDPNRADAYQLLSEISIRRNDYQGAYEYANKAIQISPKDSHSTIMLARALTALGRNNEALNKLNAALPMATDPQAVQLERINIIKKINGPRVAVNELLMLSNSSPDFHILFELAKAYVEISEPENAFLAAQHALQVKTKITTSNELASLHLLLGQMLRQSGQIDMSIDHLNEAIRIAPDRLEPYLELGLARKELRDYQQALKIFEQASSIDPEDPRALFQAGLALKESKDYKSSEVMLRRAVNLAPHDANIRRQLAAVVALNLVHNPRMGRN